MSDFGFTGKVLIVSLLVVLSGCGGFAGSGADSETAHSGTSHESPQTSTEAPTMSPEHSIDTISDTSTKSATPTGTRTPLPDPDGDDLNHSREIDLGTDPTDQDSDGDGLSDGEEVHQFETNPLEADSSGDGIRDRKAIQYGLNPSHAYSDDFVQTIHLVSPTLREKIIDVFLRSTQNVSPVGNSLLNHTSGLNDSVQEKILTQVLVDQTLEPAEVEHVAYISNLSAGYRLKILSKYPKSGEWDSDRDGILIGEESHFYTHANRPNPDMVPIIRDLQNDGKLSRNDQIYLKKLGDAYYAKEEPHSLWGQLRAINASRFHEDGKISDRELNLTGNNDLDRLINGLEDKHGTNRKNSDTDGDWLSDDLEHFRFERSNATKKDIYVEIDYVPGCNLDGSAKSKIRQVFEESPVPGGMNVHLISDDEVPISQRKVRVGKRGDLNRDDLQDYVEKYFDNQNAGYHYALLIQKDVILDGEAHGGAASGGNFALNCQYDHTGSGFLHELGHVIGLYGGLYEGIDSHSIEFDEYPSKMNYNAPEDFYGYSDGSEGANDFDDWGYLQENLAPVWTFKRSVSPDQLENQNTFFSSGRVTPEGRYNDLRVNAVHQDTYVIKVEKGERVNVTFTFDSNSSLNYPTSEVFVELKWRNKSGWTKFRESQRAKINSSGETEISIVHTSNVSERYLITIQPFMTGSLHKPVTHFKYSMNVSIN